MSKRKKKSAEERGYLPIETVVANLRALAAQLQQDNKGRLAKVTLNIWYEDPEPIETETAVSTTAGTGD